MSDGCDGRVTILLVDDHQVVREGLKRLTSTYMAAEAAALDFYEAATGDAALSICAERQPDLVIFDLNLPGGGLSCVERLVGSHPTCRVLILTVQTGSIFVSRALSIGAKGYLSKSADAREIVDAIRKVLAGGVYVEKDLATEVALRVMDQKRDAGLSAQQIDVMRLLTMGRSLSGIADQLGLPYSTISSVCTILKKKYFVDRTSDLIRVALDMERF